MAAGVAAASGRLNVRRPPLFRVHVLYRNGVSMLYDKFRSEVAAHDASLALILSGEVDEVWCTDRAGLECWRFTSQPVDLRDFRGDGGGAPHAEPPLPRPTVPYTGTG